jgi:ubiquinone/menaquinone biosynthesis C-methylase UbiE
MAALAAAVYFGRQVRKPTRFVGRFFARLMNTSHAPLSDWALAHLEIGRDAVALDVGCGGGRTIEKLAAKAAKVYGIDYAAGSVAESLAHNQRLIGEGRVFVERGSVSHLPFEDSTFDIATAIETQYYWSDVESDMREILRVLKPGGRLMVVAESYRGARNDWLLGPAMRLLGSNRLGVSDHRALFEKAGYAAIEIVEERSKGWLCAIGQKPS